MLACESNEGSSTTEKNVSLKRVRFTRSNTTPTTLSALTETTAQDITTNSQSIEGSGSTIEALNESTDNKQSNETFESVESSIVTGSPSISVEIATKKSFRVRNCGERIGDDIPFIVILVHTNPFDKKKRSFSKGVLISDNFVMATVSSIYHSEPFWTVSSVRLGDFVTWNKYANRDKSLSVEVDVDEIFYHKKKDLALIKLKESITFSDVIRPVCLPISDNYNFKELQSHVCKRSHNKAPADVTLEFAVILLMLQCVCNRFFTFICSLCRLRCRRLIANSSSHENTWPLRTRNFACGMKVVMIVRAILELHCSQRTTAGCLSLVCGRMPKQMM